MEIILGALVTVIVQVLRKLYVKFGSDWTILFIAALTFLAAYLYSLAQSTGFLTSEMLASWGKVVAYQFSMWAVVVKYILPKLETK